MGKLDEILAARNGSVHEHRTKIDPFLKTSRNSSYHNSPNCIRTRGPILLTGEITWELSRDVP